MRCCPTEDQVHQGVASRRRIRPIPGTAARHALWGRGARPLHHGPHVPDDDLTGRRSAFSIGYSMPRHQPAATHLFRNTLNIGARLCGGENRG